MRYLVVEKDCKGWIIETTATRLCPWLFPLRSLYQAFYLSSHLLPSLTYQNHLVFVTNRSSALVILQQTPEISSVSRMTSTILLKPHSFHTVKPSFILPPAVTSTVASSSISLVTSIKHLCRTVCYTLV